MPSDGVKSKASSRAVQAGGPSLFHRGMLRGKGFAIACVLLALLAFALRLLVSSELLANDVQVSNPSGFTDMWTYKDLSERILRGEYVKEFYYQPFYYAVFLPAAHFVFGASAWAVILAQALTGAGAVLIAGFSAAMLWGRRAGLIAAALSAFSAALILYTPYRLIETSQAFWISLLFLLTLLAFRKGGVFRWGFAGLILSFSILTRGNSWIFLPAIVAACVLKEAVIGKRFWRACVSLLAIVSMTLLPQIPFAARNSASAGKLCGPSTAAAAVLALGNTPEAPPGGRNPGEGPGPMEYPPSFQIWMDGAEKESVPHRILSWAKAEPLAFAELQFRKALLFWDWSEIPNNIAFEHNGAKSKRLQVFGLVPTGLIVALALAGMLAMAGRWRSRPGVSLLAYFILAYCAATVAFYILARFRVPIIPLLAVMAAGFLDLCLRDAFARRYKSLLLRKLAALAIGLFLSLSAYSVYRYGYEASVMSLVRPDGIQVKVSDAEHMALDNGPYSFGSWGTLKLEPGARFEKTLRIPPGFSTAKVLIGSAWAGPGAAIVSLNGVSKSFKAKGPGQMDLEFEIPAPSDGKFAIEALRVDGEASLLADRQRNYGRSSLDGKPLDAELVLRARLKR